VLSDCVETLARSHGAVWCSFLLFLRKRCLGIGALFFFLRLLIFLSSCSWWRTYGIFFAALLGYGLADVVVGQGLEFVDIQLVALETFADILTLGFFLSCAS
jgi:hypothetical protein